MKPSPLTLASSLSICNLEESDCLPISEAFTRQGWNKPAEQHYGYFRESLEGKREILVAKVAGKFAGYLTIVWQSDYPSFREAGIPEIVDFNVLKKHQRRGIGAALMDAAERRIAARSPIAGIGVGLTPDYGAAQILYVKRRAIPDGRGALWGGRKTIASGDTLYIDDLENDLVLFFTKAL